MKAGQAEAGQIEQLQKEKVWLWCLVGSGNAWIFVYETILIVLEKFVAEVWVKDAKSWQFEFVAQVFMRMNERHIECWHVLFDACRF